MHLGNTVLTLEVREASSTTDLQLQFINMILDRIHGREQMSLIFHYDCYRQAGDYSITFYFVVVRH